MATITRQVVTISVAEQDTLCSILGRYASSQWDQARKTKSAAIREFCESEGAKARDLEASIVRRMYATV